MFRAATTASRTTRSTRFFSTATRQAKENNTVAGAAVKGIEKAGEMAQKVKEATGLGTGQAKGAANETAGQVSGKVEEMKGKASGTAAELEGKAKGAFEQGKAKGPQ